MYTTTSLSTLVEKMLPSFSGGAVTYNKENNIFLTAGYTSQAGNTYYQGIRLSNRIVISYSIGEGYAYTFLNGINIYGFDGNKKKLIASMGLHNTVFSEELGADYSVKMVMNYLLGQAKLSGATFNDRELCSFATMLVDEARHFNPARLLG